MIFFTAKLWRKTAMASKPVLGRDLVTKNTAAAFHATFLAMKSSDVLVCLKLPVYSKITGRYGRFKQAQQDRPESKLLSRVRSRLTSIIVQQAMSSSHMNCGGTSLVCLRHRVCTGLSEGHPYLLISCHTISIIITHPHTVFLSLH